MEIKAKKNNNLENLKFIKNESFDLISPKNKKSEIEGNYNLYYLLFIIFFL